MGKVLQHKKSHRSLAGQILASLGSTLVARERFGYWHGLTHVDDDTGLYNRDYYNALGYNRQLLYSHYRARFERGDIARRIVIAEPAATWTGNVVLTEDPDPHVDGPFETAVEKLYKDLDVWGRVLRADILAGIGRYGVLLIGARGKLSSPLPNPLRPEDILYLTPLDEDKAKINTIVGNTNDPRFGLPLDYELNLGVKVNGVAEDSRTETCHWSRIIHIAEGCLSDDIYGEPRLKAVWNRLDDLDKVLGGGAEAAWQGMAPGMHLNMDPDVELSEAEEDNIESEVEEYINGMRRVIRSRGIDVNLLSRNVAGFGPNADALITVIAAAKGIPKRLLSGSERGELASSQDRGNWADRIDERRRLFGEPLIRQLTDRLIDHKALPDPGDYAVLWPKIDELNETEKATIVNKLTQANASSGQAGGGLVFTADEIRDMVWGLGPRPPEADVKPQVSRVPVSDVEPPEEEIEEAPEPEEDEAE